MALETLTAAQYFSRIMVEGIDDRRLIKAPCGGQALFGEPMGNGGQTRYAPDSEVIEFDVRKGNRGISTFVKRGTYSQPINKPKHVSGNFTSLARTFPLLLDSGIVTADQLLKRVHSESPYMPLTQWERARRHCGEVFEDIVLDHIYAMEYSAWQMIKTGKMDLVYNTSDANEKIDTKRTATHTFTVSASWATAGTSILGDVDSVCTLGVVDAGRPYDVMVVGSNTPGYIQKNTDILALAGIRGAGASGFDLIYFGNNNPVPAKLNYLVGNGYTPICQLKTPMGRVVNVMTYEGTYVRSGSTTYYVTAKEAVFFHSDAACDRYFGPYEKLPPTQQMVADWNEIFGFSPENISLPPNLIATDRVVDPMAFSCDVRRTPDNKAFEVAVQAAPMFVTRDTDSFAYIADVTAP